MSFQLKSMKLIEQFSKLIPETSGKRVGAMLSVSDEASWWYFHEFGTATHQGEGDFPTPPSVQVQPVEGTANTTGYPILPNEAEAIRLPGIAGGEPKIVPQVGAEYTLEHPGVPALAIVRTVLEEVHKLASTEVAVALKEAGYQDLNSVQTAIKGKVLPATLELITDSIAAKMPPRTDRDLPGKLGGASPADVFKRSATIIDIVTEE